MNRPATAGVSHTRKPLLAARNAALDSVSISSCDCGVQTCEQVQFQPGLLLAWTRSGHFRNGGPLTCRFRKKAFVSVVDAQSGVEPPKKVEKKILKQGSE